MARKLQPVSVAGIEGDALISEDVNYSADIPEYPVEKGYNVSDTIILKPVELSITMYISDSPATWRYRKGHSPSAGRTKKICKKLEDLYFKRKLVKVVTTDKIYTSMGITSMTISHSSDIGYARQVQMSLKKVYVTKRKTVYIPSYILQSGDTKSNAGTATTSSSSSSSSSSSGSSSSKSSSSSSKSSSSSEKKSSILYGVASSMGFL
jgi:hypothetical protein